MNTSESRLSYGVANITALFLSNATICFLIAGHARKGSHESALGVYRAALWSTTRQFSCSGMECESEFLSVGLSCDSHGLYSHSKGFLFCFVGLFGCLDFFWGGGLFWEPLPLCKSQQPGPSLQPAAGSHRLLLHENIACLQSPVVAQHVPNVLIWSYQLVQVRSEKAGTTKGGKAEVGDFPA